MYRNKFFNNTQNITTIAWLLVLTFGYGCFVGFSGRMLVGIGNEHGTMTESHEGRFAQTARML